MKCPSCKVDMEREVLHKTEIDYCPRCLGIWFERDELRSAKDGKDKELNWLDIDLWKDRTHFKIAKRNDKYCPEDEVPLYEVSYNDSNVKVYFCSVCEGTWLDRGEFKDLVDYLEEKKKKEVLHNYFRSMIKETSEVFTGPETLKGEVSDLFTVIKLLNYKLAVQYPEISKTILGMPR